MKITLYKLKLSLTALGVLVLAGIHSVRAQEGAWANGAAIPTTSYGLSGAFTGGKFYAISGFATPRLEIYDPANNTWTTGAPVPADTGFNLRQYAGTTVLDGKVYVVGGDTGGSGDRATLLRYDPAANTWATLAPMPLGGRYNLGAAALNGKIYAVGGYSIGTSSYLSRVEEYDPVSNAWTTKAAMPTAHAGALVGAIGGKLYVAGGADASGQIVATHVYDPDSDSWATLAPLPFVGSGEGMVLGGKLYSIGSGPSPETRVFAFDPAANSWSTNFAPMPTGRHGLGLAADELNNRIFAVGGWNGSYVPALEIFTPPLIPTLTNIVVTPANPTVGVGTNQQFTATGSFNDGTSRPLTSGGNTWATGAAIASPSYGLGGAFVGGKFYAISGFATTRVGAYDPTNNSWANAAPLPQLLQYFGTAVLDGKIYVVGGDTGGGGQRSTLYRYDPTLNSWTNLAPMPLGARYNLAAAALNGKIYAVGGHDGTSLLDRVEIYNPANNSWTTGSPLPTPRTMPLLGAINGKIYLAGGYDNAGPVTNGFFFDPAANTWDPIAPMAAEQAGVAAVLGGKLYVIGGYGPDNRVQSYDPRANAWSTNYATLPTGRRQMALAADEVSGRIFAASGYNNTYSFALEMFTPPGEVTWSSGSPLVASVNSTGWAAGLSVGGATITATAGAVAGTTLLTVVTQPAIITQPLSATVSPNGTTTFTVGASGGGLSYQWRLNGTNILGANGPSLNLNSLTANQAGVYSVIISNVAGSITSSTATLSLLSVARYAGLTIVGQVGGNYQIEYLNDLNSANWISLTNVVLPSSPYLFIDQTSPPHQQRFYRAGLTP